jgi:DNA-binding response OmpR family regulator
MSESTDRNSINLHGITVLVVEDDYFIASEICAALSSGNARVVGPVADPHHGLELIEHTPVDCVVLDINLLGEPSFELAHELQRRGVPVIFATGYDEEVIPLELTNAIRLEKPINLTELLHAVRSTTTLLAGH